MSTVKFMREESKILLGMIERMEGRPQMIDEKDARIASLEAALSAAEARAEKAEAEAERDALLKQRDAIRKPVREFAQDMERKLKANDDKGGWGIGDCKFDWLFERLLEEVEELREAVKNRRGLSVIDEAADVANFAMMLADRVRE